MSIPKWLFFPISASDVNIHPRNTVCMTAVNIEIFLELGKNPSFMDGHWIIMLAVIGSLGIGLIIGFLGQRSRMCFIGGFRDFLMIRDKELLKGAISFFASAWLTIVMLNVLGKLMPAISDAANVKYVAYPPFVSAALSKFGAISLIGGLGLGFFSTLAGGCPLRQHVMAGQGRVDATVYLSGFYLGIIIYYLFVVELIAKVM